VCVGFKFGDTRTELPVSERHPYVVVEVDVQGRPKTNRGTKRGIDRISGSTFVSSIPP